MTTSIGTRDARVRLGDLIHHVNTEKEEVIVTMHGKPRAVLMSFAAYEALHVLLAAIQEMDVPKRRALLKNARTRGIS